MQRAAIVLSVALALSGCGQAEEEEAEIRPAEGEPTQQVAVNGALPSPTRGGTVVMAGQRAFEVVAARSGQLSAYYVGEPPAQPQDARVTVRVPDQTGQVRPVLLTWDPAQVKYTGQLRGSEPAAGPIELVWVFGGETLRASATTYIILADEAVAALEVEARRRPRPPAVIVQNQPPPPPQVIIQDQRPPPPQVIVRPPPPPPQPQVIVRPPPPPPHVIVRPPPPPQPQVIVRPPQPPQPRVIVQPPQPPQPRVIVRPEPPPRPQVIVRPPQPPQPRVIVRPEPPPRPQVIVRPAEPPPQPRVVVRPPEPPQPRVVVRPGQPPPPPRVIVRPPPGDRNRGHGNDRDGVDEDNPGRGRRH